MPSARVAYADLHGMISEPVKRVIDPNALESFACPRTSTVWRFRQRVPAVRLRQHLVGKVGYIRWALCHADRWRVQHSQILYRRQSAMFKNARPAIINGIGEFGSQHDLLDRAIAVWLPTMPAGTRLTEKAEEAIPDYIGRVSSRWIGLGATDSCCSITLCPLAR